MNEGVDRGTIGGNIGQLMVHRRPIVELAVDAFGGDAQPRRDGMAAKVRHRVADHEETTMPYAIEWRADLLLRVADDPQTHRLSFAASDWTFYDVDWIASRDELSDLRPGDEVELSHSRGRSAPATPGRAPFAGSAGCARPSCPRPDRNRRRPRRVPDRGPAARCRATGGRPRWSRYRSSTRLRRRRYRRPTSRQAASNNARSRSPTNAPSAHRGRANRPCRAASSATTRIPRGRRHIRPARRPS